MPGLRDLKQRIKGIQGMRKVTRAMQMVSAAKMRKAQDAVVSSRTYAELAWELVNNVSSAGMAFGENQGEESMDSNSSDAPSMMSLMATYPKAKKIGVVILSTNRGLVGSLNTNLQPVVKKLGVDADVITEMVVYGKYAKQIAVRLNKEVVADFPKAERKITSADIYPIAEYITEAYKTGDYRQIVIVYNHFVSTLVQKPRIKQLLPFVPAAGSPPHGETVVKNSENSPASSSGEEYTTREQDTRDIDSPYIFEPTPQIVLDHLLPRIIESQLYETILESDASEHSARMVMMKNATEAAGDLIDDYTLTYNQLRQGKITTELSEITAGRIALE